MKIFRLLLPLVVLLLFDANVVAAQTHSVSGTVVNQQGEPLVGVAVLQKETGNGVVTNLDGEFTIALDTNGQQNLTISYIGYMDSSVSVNSSQSNINVVMQEQPIDMEEVVVVGYGTAKKSDLTGAMSSVKRENLPIVPTTDIMGSLEGSMPGVLISGGNGSPGSNASVSIRGVNSISADTNPLIVVDGFPLSHGNISDINPDDIKTVDVLKDASAAAIYGARGSNGVILITTKRADKDGTQIKYSGYISFSSLIKKLDFLSGDELYEFRREGMRAAGNPNPSMEEVLANDPVMINAYKNKEYIDWQDEMFSTAITHHHDLSILYQNEKVNNMFAVNYHNQEGMMEHSGYNKIGFRNNITYTPYKWLEVGSNINFSISNYEDLPGGVLGNTMNLSPIGNLYDDGDLAIYTNSESSSGNSQMKNPLFILQQSEQERQRSRFIGNFYAQATIIEGLKYRFSVGLDETYSENNQWTSAALESSDAVDGGAKVYNDRASSFNMDNMLTYDKTIADKHSINTTLLYNIYTSRSHTNSMTNQGFSNQDLNWGQIGQGIEPTVNRYGDEWNLQSFMARLNYSYDNRYSATVTYRLDGSSKFGANNKYASFPSVAAAWRISEESFMDGTKSVLSALKLRASYGTVGNQSIPTYSYITYPSAGYYKPFGGLLDQYYIYPSGKDKSAGPGNPDIKWEQTATFNLGLDFGFLKNRINGSIEFYNSNTKDMLLYREIPRTNGAYKMYDNVGAVRNTGVEVALNTFIINKNDFRWNVDATFTYNRNEIMELNVYDENGNPLNDYTWGRIIGEPINSIYERVALGIFNSQAEIDAHGYMSVNSDGSAGVWTPLQPNAKVGDIKFADLNGDKKINDLDRMVQGSSVPKWYGSLRSTFGWRGLEFSFLLTTKQGMTKVNNWITSVNFSGTNSVPDIKYWTPENHDAVLPRPNSMTQGYNDIGAIAIQDASYVSLQNVSLSYKVPAKIASKLRMSNLKVSITGNNLKYWTDFYGYSPETNSRGAYPDSKSFTLSLQTTF